ncbi:glycosyltransferase [Pigmentiphaga litoralis]|uniref:glycosyltransferase n=1 Tax=Pigmentiphaga litoralis TaxID=516702 RepID=UPI003B429BE5
MNVIKMPTVAVLLAVYNGECYLREQVESILGQEDVKIALFAYDDRSTDNSWQLLQDLASKDARITIARNEVSSGSAFNNFYGAIKAFRTVEFDYIALSDQDDVWMPEKLSRQISSMLATNSDGCSTSVQTFGTRGEQAYINNAGRQSSLDFLFTGAGQGCTYVVSNRLFQEIRNHVSIIGPVSLPHDWFIYATARRLGFRWLILREPLILYRQHQNVFGARTSLKGIKFRIQMLRSQVFLSNRVSLLKFLRTIPSDGATDKIEELASVEHSLAKRAAFALKHLFLFRRFRAQSVVMAALFVAGLA